MLSVVSFRLVLKGLFNEVTLKKDLMSVGKWAVIHLGKGYPGSRNIKCLGANGRAQESQISGWGGLNKGGKGEVVGDEPEKYSDCAEIWVIVN